MGKLLKQEEFVGQKNSKRRDDYIYKIGDIIQTKKSNLEILKQIRIETNALVRGKRKIVSLKGYLVRCLTDGYEYEVKEDILTRGYGCPVCNNKIVIKGINDVATTHPEIAKYFENVEETYTTTYSSGKKKRMRCPKCGHVKLDSPNHISYFGFSCPCCSDGVSYPNKFMSKLLQELNEEFDREIFFEWCKFPSYVDNNNLDFGIYDFVIPSKRIIIEMDGELGHGRNIMNTTRKQRRVFSVDETIYRDSIKDKLAITNGYKVIRIDCVYDKPNNRYKIISNNIKKSELSNIYDLEKINFDDIDKYCLNNSYIIDASELWNNGLTISQICKEIRLSPTTVTSYLKFGSKIGICNYNTKNSAKRSTATSNIRSPYMVLIGQTKQVFDSFKEMHIYYKNNYNIELSYDGIRYSINKQKEYLNRTFRKISQEEFNKYYNDKSLADLVVGEAFLIT